VTALGAEEPSSGEFRALRLDDAAVAWVRGGRPGATPLP
jgi:hypothetical protein